MPYLLVVAACGKQVFTFSLKTRPRANLFLSRNDLHCDLSDPATVIPKGTTLPEQYGARRELEARLRTVTGVKLPISPLRILGLAGDRTRLGM